MERTRINTRHCCDGVNAEKSIPRQGVLNTSYGHNPFLIRRSFNVHNSYKVTRNRINVKRANNEHATFLLCLYHVHFESDFIGILYNCYCSEGFPFPPPSLSPDQSNS
uniref:Uncharacterized protein n=1 Tax=Sipha flava TaxID=143950 RepID=A0A2S2Q9E9_9HEMI